MGITVLIHGCYHSNYGIHFFNLLPFISSVVNKKWADCVRIKIDSRLVEGMPWPPVDKLPGHEYLLCIEMKMQQDGDQSS